MDTEGRLIFWVAPSSTYNADLSPSFSSLFDLLMNVKEVVDATELAARTRAK